MSEEKDVLAESSSALGEAIASTPEVQQEVQEALGTETGTPQQPASQEQNVPFNEHPRFKELIDERNWYRQQLEQRLNQQPQQPIQQPQSPQEIGNNAEEREFWRMIDKRAEMIAEQKLQKVSPMLEAGIREMTNMKVQQFRESHKDIRPNSPEEIQIAQKIQQGYQPEDAYRVVMWDKKVAEAENKGNTIVRQKIEAKKQANVEQRSIPQGNNLPVKEKLTLRQRIEREAANMDL